MWKVLTAIVVTNFACCLGENEKRNVCENICGYSNIDEDKGCWFNPDVCSDPKDIITRRGYPFQSYDIQTKDGYKNVLYRIPHNNTHRNLTRWPILLRGGIGGGAQTFLYIGNRSLAFFLVNNGFDVWLSNRRGTVSHTDDQEFWDFSFHEIGCNDIKPEIDLIRKKTGRRQKVVLLGYSMGTTETYVYAMLRKKHANKNVSGIISVAPIAFLAHCGGLLAKLVPYAKVIESVLRTNNIHALFNKQNITEPENLRLSFEEIVLSRYIMFLMAGNDSGQINPSDLPVYHCRSTPISLKSFVHYAQEVSSGGKFQQYDHGSLKNLIYYRSLNPPVYNVSKIRVPVHLFYGEADLLSTPEDVVELYNTLRVKNKSMTHISVDNKTKFNHVDFSLAKNITTLFHEVLLKIIRENLRE